MQQQPARTRGDITFVMDVIHAIICAEMDESRGAMATAGGISWEPWSSLCCLIATLGGLVALTVSSRPAVNLKPSPPKLVRLHTYLSHISARRIPSLPAIQKAQTIHPSPIPLPSHKKPSPHSLSLPPRPFGIRARLPNLRKRRTCCAQNKLYFPPHSPLAFHVIRSKPREPQTRGNE